MKNQPKQFISCLGSRSLERTCCQDIEHLLNENRENISKLKYVTGIKNIHTTEVQNFLNNKSKLLGRIPPILSPNESKLDRKTRCTLSQLRSRYSIHFASYHHRLNNIPDVYLGPHTTDHQDECRVHPTSPTIESL